LQNWHAADHTVANRSLTELMPFFVTRRRSGYSGFF
jgi:hypothetical protein